MSRDLGGEVEKLMKSTNPYLKKKVRRIRARSRIEPSHSRLFYVPSASSGKFPNSSMCFKIPFEVYSVKKTMVSTIASSFSSIEPWLIHSLGVLLAATTLITEMCHQNAQALQIFRKVRRRFSPPSTHHGLFSHSVSAESGSCSEDVDHGRLQSRT